jgi:hypothetical protein
MKFDGLELEVEAFVVQSPEGKYMFALAFKNASSFEVADAISEWMKKIITDNLDLLGVSLAGLADPTSPPTSGREH